MRIQTLLIVLFVGGILSLERPPHPEEEEPFDSSRPFTRRTGTTRQLGDDEPSLDDSLVQALRYVFRSLDLSDSPLGNILYDTDVDLFNAFDGFTLADIEAILEEYLQTAVDSKLYQLQNQCSSQSNHEHYGDDKADDTTDTGDDDSSSADDSDQSMHAADVSSEQVSGYEGCRRDYGALAEPITTGIIRRVARRVLENVYMDASNQEEFCEISCDVLCNVIGLGCTPICDVICMGISISENTTKHDVIDRLLAFIPYIESQPWARKSKRQVLFYWYNNPVRCLVDVYIESWSLSCCASQCTLH